MRLSADRINRKSPYWVIQLDELTFRFVTRNGIIYRVGFYKDQYFLGSRAYHFFIANDSDVNPPKDSACSGLSRASWRSSSGKMRQ